MLREIIVGSRKSKLALIQANWVMDQLDNKGVKHSFRIQEVTTKGDENTNVSLEKLGGGGVFLQELEEQLMAGDIDMAVHSLKDIPTSIPKGLTIACVPKREDHRDAYIANNHIALQDLQAGSVIGTSSLRRSAQLLAKRPDLTTQWIRGPIDSRLAQLQTGDFDAIILAVAGMKRLGVKESTITEYLPDNHFIPAMGQGALAVECRADDEEIQNMLALIHDEAAAKAVKTERLFLQAFDEGEQAPIGGHATVENGVIQLRGMVISRDGQIVLRAEAFGEEPAIVAKEVADHLIDQGALAIISKAIKGG